MKNKISLFSAIVLLALSVPVSSATLDSIKAPLHVGEKHLVCGKMLLPNMKGCLDVGEKHLVCGNVVQVTEQKKRVLLNLGRSYPNEHLSVQVWRNNLQEVEGRFGNLRALIGNRICAQGEIEEYKDHLFITIRNPQFLRLMK